MSKLDWTAQLVLLRGMTQKLGVIHEAQALQIRLWPYTVDPSLEKSEAKVDMEANRVEFVWTGSALSMDKKYQKRLETLSDNVKFLLGEEWKISVTRDEELIFPNGYKNVEPANRSRNRKPKRVNRKPKRKPSKKRK
jgi:hypothetical protein